MNGSNYAAYAIAMIFVTMQWMGTSTAQERPRYRSLVPGDSKEWVRDLNQLSEKERQQQIRGYGSTQSLTRVATSVPPVVAKRQQPPDRETSPVSHQRSSIEARSIILRPKNPIPRSRAAIQTRPNDAYAPYRNRREYEAAVAKASWRPTARSIALTRQARARAQAKVAAKSKPKSSSKRLVAKSRSTKQTPSKRNAPAPRIAKDPALPDPDSRGAVDGSLFPDF